MGVKLIKIGRSQDNDIVIDDTSISRFHLELFQDEDGNVFITDLKSTNGTTINGRRINDSEILKRNDIVKLGTAPPIPWQNYFSADELIVQPVDNDSSATGDKKELSLSWIKRGSIAAAIGLLFIFGYIYRSSFIGDSLNEDNIVVSKDEYGNPINKNGDVIIEPHRDNTDITSRPNIPQPISGEITYDFDCMENGFINSLGDIETDVIGGFNQTVSIKEEQEVGEQLYKGCQEKYRFINDSRKTKLSQIKSKLQRAIKNPRGFDYKIYLIESSEINAFTAGGYIFVTTAMYKFIKNDDELACVIGHEMAHNECNHINHQLKKQKVNEEVLGVFFGSAADALSFFLTTPFNQKRETESDFHGIDYAVVAGYNSCNVINLWTRMAEMESKGDKIDEMMRTHPYSSKRSTCCGNHIQANYKFNCEDIK